MAKVSAFHTNEVEYPPTHRNVYHDNDNCDYGADIKIAHRVPGTGGNDRCSRCIELG